jgi:predicted MFS family arabinose efflux permease
MMGIVIAISNQFCGINAIFFYAKQLFTTLTNNDQDAVKRNLFGLGVFQVLMTFVSSIYLDRFGRRSLMLMGLTIVVGSLFLAFIATEVLNLSSGIVVFFVFLHIFGFSISLGPICCLYAS